MRKFYVIKRESDKRYWKGLSHNKFGDLIDTWAVEVNDALKNPYKDCLENLMVDMHERSNDLDIYSIQQFYW